MRRVIPVFLFGIMSTIGFAQPLDKDSIIIDLNGVRISYALTNWGLSLDVGGVFYSYDKLTNQYIDNHWGPDFSVSVYRRNLSLNLYFKPATVHVSQPLDFGYQLLDEDAKLNVIKAGVSAGYTINLPYGFGIKPYVGLLRTRFLVINEEEIGSQFSFNCITGILGGVSLMKYFRMKRPGEFLTVHFSGAIAFSGYDHMHSSLGNSFTMIELGMGYHGWFRSKREIEVLEPRRMANKL